jgi:hypothetical protein
MGKPVGNVVGLGAARPGSEFALFKRIVMVSYSTVISWRGLLFIEWRSE